jgi:hypothetical protein
MATQVAQEAGTPKHDDTVVQEHASPSLEEIQRSDDQFTQNAGTISAEQLAEQDNMRSLFSQQPPDGIN